MDIGLNKLNYSFKNKPILVGGKAMEYYGLRTSGKDIDLIATEEDVIELIKLYPHRVKDLSGDLGVCPFQFEIWKTICYFDYSFYKEKAIEKNEYFIISLEKLLVMKALAMKKDKYMKDLTLIVDFILRQQGIKYVDFRDLNQKTLGNIKDITYIEETQPEE